LCILSRNCEFYHFCRVLLHIHFGSGAVRIWIQNDFSGSGSLTLAIKKVLGTVPMTLAPEPAQTAIVRTGVARLEPWPSARRRLLSPRWVFVSEIASSRLKKGSVSGDFLDFFRMNGQRPEKAPPTAHGPVTSQSTA